jgi:glycerophosphoryl diester phosphodiesterase
LRRQFLYLLSTFTFNELLPTMKKLLCFAHRGASGHEPENTLSAIEKAIDLGADWIEVDVYAVERELIVIHDERLDRTTNGTGFVMGNTLEYLRSLDAGKGQRIPTLREVFDCVDRRAGINVEMKGTETAGLTVSLINEYTNARKWHYEQFIVSSFHRRELGRVKKLDPHVRIGIVIGGFHRPYKKFVTQITTYSVHPRIDLVNAEFVRSAHERGLKVLVYTVNRPEDIARMAAMGVDGIFTDFPERVTRRQNL